MNFSTLQLRKYQLEAQSAIGAALARGCRAQLVSLATGLGKSVVIATLPEYLKLRPGDVTLVVAHRDELVTQLVEKMRAQNPDAVVGVEKADAYAADDCTIVVATVQTLTGPRLARFATKFGRRIALFIIDEAHHAAAPTYRAILDKMLGKRPDVLVIGFTATPQRGDGAQLAEIFTETVYSMDARAAIDAGYLVPVRSYAVATQVDLDAVASRAGDFVLGQLADAVDTEERNRAVLDAYVTLTPTMKALVFTASVEHARNVARLFVEAGIAAAFASGDTPQAEREAIVAGFRGDRVDVLVNCGLYLEGFDVPSIQVVINARPTKSTTLYTQVTGRGLRPLDEHAFTLSHLPTPEARRTTISQSGKPYAIVIDIVDVARRHHLVTLPTLWGLPAQIDAEGRPISTVAEQYEELFRLDAKAGTRVRTAEQIENALIDARRAADPANRQAAAWQMITPEHWFLERTYRAARDRKGRPIANFAQRFAEFTAMAASIAPNENASSFAMRMLQAEPRTMIDERQRVEVRYRDERWCATLASGRAPAREIATAPTLPDAIAAASGKMDAIPRAVHQRRQAPPAAAPAAKAKAPARRWRSRRKQGAPGAAASSGAGA